MFRVITFCVFFCAMLLVRSAAAVEDGFCLDMRLTDIPIGNFRQPLSMPIDPMRITQRYNTSREEGFCQVDTAQYSGGSRFCQGQRILYGHDGLDLHPKGAAKGDHDVMAVQEGKVVASHSYKAFGGWGESIILATRANAYSEEILTFHYHHLHEIKRDVTSRRFGRCEQVSEGTPIAKEGGTPHWPTHLHLTIRRWDNLAELQKQIKDNPRGFYGNGYSYGNNALLANYLDPEGLLYDHFREFQEDKKDFTTWQWSDSVVREMRAQGWFFGNFDGSFGVDEEVARREAARWFKQALRLPTPTSSTTPHFQDLPASDPDFPYVQGLLQDTAVIRVINPERSCTDSGRNFCPEQKLNRAEAVKMIVAGFYQESFLEVYNNWVWRASLSAATQLLSRFTDVSPSDWYAPYVYFAWQNGLLGGGAKFNPGLPIRRAELAKWLVMAHQKRFGDSSGICSSMTCGNGYYCDEAKRQCRTIPGCVPWEDQPCPLGGGYQSEEELPPTPPPPPNPGEPPPPPPPAPTPTTPPPVPPPQCVQGQEEFKICPGGPATYRLCQAGGVWSAWSPPCPDGSTPPPVCRVTYTASPAGASCYVNTAASGSPRLCLETTPSAGAQVGWRLCKDGGAFQQNFTYQLQDLNHSSQNLGGINSSASGQFCTPWRYQDFSYINQNGPTNGAGLRVEMRSPTGCTSPACTYYSGMTTVYRQCQ